MCDILNSVWDRRSLICCSKFWRCHGPWGGDEMSLMAMLASVSTQIFLMLLSMHNLTPLYIAFNSAAVLEMSPRCSWNAKTAWPRWFLMIPPAPATPGFPFEAPSVFNLNHPLSGLIHLTIEILDDIFWGGSEILKREATDSSHEVGFTEKMKIIEGLKDNTISFRQIWQHSYDLRY